MIDSLLRKEVIEKLKRHLDDSYVILKIGDLRELIPDLTDLSSEFIPKLSPPSLPARPPKESQKLSSSEKPIVGKDEIIPLFELEKRLIHAALERTSGCVKRAAKLTEMSERNFRRKLEEHGIDHKKYKRQNGKTKKNQNY